MRPAIRPAILVALALPALAGAGTCGLIYDISQLQLVLEPISRVDVDSDAGGLEVYAFDRNGTVVSYYLHGFDASLKDVGFAVDGDLLDVYMWKGGPAEVTADFYLELPLGTELTLDVRDGPVKLTGVDAPVSGHIAAGDVEGVRLAAPELELSVDAGAVALEFVAPVARVAVTAEQGDITLTVPAGAYRCDLDAADEPAVNGVSCDDAAAAALVLAAPAGAILLEGTPP